MSCLDENTIERFVDGALPDAEAAAVEEHIDACADCRTLVSALGKVVAARPGETPSSRPTLELAQAEASAEISPRREQPLERGDLVGRYVVLALLGSGGMGIVYAAYDPELDRKVALKLLRSGLNIGGTRGTSWLLREAKLMARLQHPNVITVHDVGELEGRVFVAMEHLEGMTLGAWLRERPRAWREVLETFLQAGAGLAAAHDAGLVHRDFKPGNVMVTREGRVKVLDFGLARPVSRGPLAPSSPDDGDSAPPQAPTVQTRLTRSGAVVGTPLYMAPEQHRGAPADTRTDQFGYCLALYEALYGEPPFPGADEKALMEAKEQGRIQEPARSSSVPGSIRRALLKGLSARREERHPDMATLLRHLAPRRGGQRRLFAALTAGIALGLGVWGVAAALREAPPDLLCKGGERKLVGVWDGARAAAVRRSFLATRKPYAAAASRQTEKVLGAYTRKWVRERGDACEATRVRGVQSERLLDLRMQCYSQRLAEVKALVDLFLEADAKVVEKAVSAVHGLDPVTDCADPRRLRSSRPARDGAARERAARLMTDLARARALQRSGKYRAAIVLTKKISDAAAAARDGQIEGEARWLLGHLEELAGDARRALRQTERALWAAQRVGDDRLVSQSASSLVQVYGYRLGKFEFARSWARFASAAIERLGGDATIEANLACHEGGAEYGANRYRVALKHLRRCLEVRRRALGERHPDTAAAFNDVGLVLWNLGRYPDSLEHHRKALRLRRELLGARHPETAVSLNNIGLVLWTQGRFAKAEANLREAVAIRKAALGNSHPDVATALSNLGLVLRARGSYEEALRIQRQALSIRHARLGENHDDTANSVNNVAVILGTMGRFAEALEMAKRAYKIRSETIGKDSVDAARTLTNVGRMLHGLGRYSEALERHRSAVAVAEKKLGTNHPALAKQLISLSVTLQALKRERAALTLLERAARIARSRRGKRHPLVASALRQRGEIYLKQRRWRDAAKALEEALRILERRRSTSLGLAPVRFSLARALATSEPERARRLGTLALKAYRAADTQTLRSRIAPIEKWLRER